MFRNGYLPVAHWKGTPIRLHWTLPVGALLLGGLSPVFWVVFFGLVLVHEMGHAALVRRYGHQVLSLDVTGFGGMCRWAGQATDHERSVIAWGGVIAQAAVLIVAGLTVAILGWPQTWPLRQVTSVLIGTNALLIGLNLLPIPPFDGAQAWKLVTRYYRQMTS
jgi:Zn-dependent protease